MKLCKCGCGGEIVEQKHHKWYGVPDYIQGHNNYCMSDETRSKISKAGKGRVFSEEHRRRISEALKNHRFSEETKRKISEAHKGKPSHRKGKTLSIESRKKMSEAHKGYKPSTEARRNMSLSRVGRHAGEKHWNWKGGITPEYISKGRSWEWKEWRRKVFERDDFTCQICGDNTGGNLNPHHIISRKTVGIKSNLWFNVSNGITLCKNCHKEIHKRLYNNQPTIMKYLMNRNKEKESVE